MSGQLRAGVEELHRYGHGTCIRCARASAEAKVKAWLASQAQDGIPAEVEQSTGEVVGLVLEFPPPNEEQAWG